MALFEPVFAALDAHRVRYVVVGGVATVLHGFPRLTADVDLVVDLAPDAARNAMLALSSIGLVPRAPVTASDFANPSVRRSWIEDKGMVVFSMWNPSNPLLEVDVFTENPIEFEQLWARSETRNVRALSMRIACIADLIAMKRLVGRPQDLLDIEALTDIARRRGSPA